MRHRLLYNIGIIFFGIWLSACVAEEVFVPSPQGFTFRLSTDTLQFDTVFTQRGSTSRRLWIYNDAAQNFSLDFIGVSQNSPFSLIINGTAAKSSTGEILRAADSLQIFVNVNIDPGNEESPFIIRDSIEIRSGDNQQFVQLLAYGQDAIYIGDTVFSQNLQWNPQKAVVLLKSVLVDSSAMLSISAGTQVFADRGAYLFVAGKMHALGEKENPIRFLNSRQDGVFRNAPGQWGGIIFLEGSAENHLDWVIIRNAEYGIRIGSPDNDTIPNLRLSNAIIENTLSAGLLSFTTDVQVENTLINNSFGYTAAFLAGGWVDLNHVTIANFGFSTGRNEEALLVSDQVVLANNQILSAPMRFGMHNSIVWGSFPNETVFFEGTNGNLNLILSHNLVRSNRTFWDTSHLINQNPQFLSPQSFDYRPAPNSPVRAKGVASTLSFDLAGRERSNPPSIGAYEVVIE